ncbi:MAG: YHS domain-containing protein, partial [Candidatus Omnitrophica bacterium]|nr:YHS domain-containing protein [Candidatus Omnitrophota bacterium]MDD5137461.1 YHS domain-containing protein [Candidatus Omnitrophota bacterium]
MKMRTMALVFSFFLCGVVPVCAQAQTPDEEIHATDPQTTVATVDNKVCPVTGKKIPREDLGKYAIEYKGKIYNLCSAACKDEFMKDPDTYAARAQE